ncbi:ERI1 exoribonuclease 3-like [Neodiprion fabricii]|uniref:ERI1 exoribonuclease 3-like n=1 Tax=Neodiprion fabricii TaxID=2872261 RepID=UPI001ED8E39C|nr:ERI1 exoribonuclease 3-like [Neodiprion fabricii]
MMAQRFLQFHPAFKINKRKNVTQSFKYLLVLDFEATCKKDVKLRPQEIIELPCLALCTKTWEVKDVFHEYIKPQIHPVLTSHCTDLTGIIQEMVDDRQHFPEIFLKFQEWLDQGNFLKGTCNGAFVTCGNWDLGVMLPEQSAITQTVIPDYFHKWINLKTSFYTATGHYPKSLVNMLRHLDLPHTGHLHSGIDDVYNMSRIIQMLGMGCKVNFEITSELGN